MGGFSDFLGSLGVDANLNIGGGIGTIISSSILLILLTLAGGLVAFVWANRRAYNKHIHLFEDINGVPASVGEDKAREITLPFTSVRAFLLKKRKMYLPRPSIQMGKDHYWYFIREDGEWVNVGLESLNAKLNQLKIKFDHTDMRMANASLKKLVEKNYKKLNWLKEYAPYIGFAIIIIMLGIAGYLTASETNKGIASAGENAKVFGDIAEHLDKILVNIDRISSTSGIRSAEIG